MSRTAVPQPPFMRKALIGSLLPVLAGGAQAHIGTYSGYVGRRATVAPPLRSRRP